MIDLSLYTNEALSPDQQALKNTILEELSGGFGLSTTSVIKSRPPNTNLTGFCELVKNVVDLENQNLERRVLVVEQMPDTNFFEDPDEPLKEVSGLILTTVLKREPATLVGGNEPFNPKRRDIRPRMIRAEIKNDPERPGEVVYVISKLFDNLVGLNICARTNKRADELAEWFEDLMEKNRWYFERKGFLKVFFEGRMADLRRDDSMIKMSFRPLKYYVRTETYYTITEQQLNRIVVQIKV